MPLYPYRGVWPTLAPDVFIAPGAQIVGDVRLGPGVNVWYNATIRADESYVEIGARTNVQDNAVIHVDGDQPCVIGADCSLAHSVIVHAATLGRHVLVGMHATILSHAVVGDEVIIGANALVGEHKTIAGGMIAFGTPAKALRPLTEAERARIVRNAATYLLLAGEHRASLLAAGVALDGARG